MRYCLPFDSASSTARATLHQTGTAVHTSAPATQYTFHEYSLSPSHLPIHNARESDRNITRIKQVVEEIIIIFTTSHSIQHLVTILRAHCGPTEEWL